MLYTIILIINYILITVCNMYIYILYIVYIYTYVYRLQLLQLYANYIYIIYCFLMAMDFSSIESKHDKANKWGLT